MTEVRYVCAASVIGAGVDEIALDKAMEASPHFVASDAGTTDAGPHPLGSGAPAFTRAAVAKDLRAILHRTRRAGIPFLLGSAGTAGRDSQVDWFAEILQEIIEEDSLGPIRVARVYAEQDPACVAQWYAQGKLKPLSPAPQVSEESLSALTGVVAMSGVEPLQEALQQGADVVIAGRCSDPAIFAALPIQQGIPEGLAWHAGKVVECGTLACETFLPGVMTVSITEESFIVRPIGEGLRCTPQSIAAHSLYESADPYRFVESSGTLDITEADYKAQDEISVRVSGSRFISADQRTVKLEGASLRGYQSFIIGGVTDPFLIGALDDWLQDVRARTHARVEALSTAGTVEDYELSFHVYGRDAVAEHVPDEADGTPHEIGIVASVTAKTPEAARDIMNLARQPLLHAPVPHQKGAVTGFACLHNPSIIDRGAVYEFALNHVLEVEGATEVFQVHTEVMQ